MFFLGAQKPCFSNKPVILKIQMLVRMNDLWLGVCLFEMRSWWCSLNWIEWKINNGNEIIGLTEKLAKIRAKLNINKVIEWSKREKDEDTIYRVAQCHFTSITWDECTALSWTISNILWDYLWILWNEFLSTSWSIKY